MALYLKDNKRENKVKKGEVSRVVSNECLFSPALKHKLAGIYERFKLTSEYATFTPSQKRFCEVFFTTNAGGVFCTGDAGTGKSYVMRILINFLMANGIAVGKTSSTGISALQIEGSTLHSFMGIGLAQEDARELINKIFKNPKVKERIMALEVLLMDEISMLKGDLLDKIDVVLRGIRWKDNDKPFGGIRICACGDGLQLPPVWKGRNETKVFFFQSELWQKARIKTVILKEIVRQENDPEFAKLLGRLRRGDTSKMKLLASRVNGQFPNDGIEPTIVYCKNIDVNAYNKKRLDQIPEKSEWFYADDWGTDYQIANLDKNCPAPKALELKVGATVMLLQNLSVETGFVNGSIGKVCSFSPDGIHVQFKNGKILVEKGIWEVKEQEAKLGGGFKFKTIAKREQYPLKVCFAVTVHKTQGATLDRAIIDMGEAFAEGQVYVALSRVRNLASLSITDCPVHRIRVNQECLDFYERAEKEQEQEEEEFSENFVENQDENLL